MNPLTSTPSGGGSDGDQPGQPDLDRLPSFSEQVADQLGGVRGLIESSIPVTAFVIANIVSSVKTAVIVAVATALAVAAFRFSRREPVRHAINGLFGIALGAWLALRSGEARDFYLPGIFISLGYAVAMVISVIIKQPIVGWIWSVVMAKGSSQWRTQPRMVRTFGWLTILWASIYALKVIIQGALYAANAETALGVVRVAMGYPPYALLLLITVWAVRRVTRDDPEVTGPVTRA